MNAVVNFSSLGTPAGLRQLEFEFDIELKTLFSWMKPRSRPCFNPDLVREITRAESLLETQQGWMLHAGRPARVDYAVFGSRFPGVFSLGGDLELFLRLITRQERAPLEAYARECVQNIHRRITGLGGYVTTISLVQGKAMGGGFECALAADLIVAERSASFSLPETLFNLFPGMGGLSFLARRIGLKKADEIVMSGAVFTAKEMFEIGVVDELVEDGLGAESVRKMIQARQRRAHSYRSMKVAKQFYQPVSLAELQNIVNVWVDSALKLESRDLRMMARLVRGQDKLLAAPPEDEEVEAIYVRPARAASGGST
jgi:DSF synthase